MDIFLLSIAVVAVYHFILAVNFLFFDIPTAHENRVQTKRKREETTYKCKVSMKYDHPTTTLNAKQSLEEVLLDA
jgi:succinate dehydrogenase/fumarate reductase cytochrome b subunit